MQNFKTLASKTKELLRFKVKVAPRIADRGSRFARAEIPAYRRSLRSLKICFMINFDKGGGESRTMQPAKTLGMRYGHMERARKLKF